MKFGVYLALVGAVSATQIRRELLMTDKSDPVPRSSAEAQSQSLVQHGHSDDDDSDEDHKAVLAGPATDAPKKDETHVPELTYRKSYDHELYSGDQLKQDNDRMKVDITTKTKGPYCTENDFVVATWKKWNGTDGTKMEDVKEKGDGRPAVFRVGNFEVSKCLDIAAQQMKAGESATIHCPTDLDQGGSVQNIYEDQGADYYLQSTTPTKYKLSIEECSLHPKYLAAAPDLESLVEGYPFYILSEDTLDGEKMAITVDPTDQYAPRTTGVHNVFLNKWEGKEHPSTYQQWIWNKEEQSIKSVGQHGGALFEGFNKNMIVYNWKGLHNQRFHYNLMTKRFQNTFTHHAMDIFGDKIVQHENINTNEPDKTEGQKWLIEYHAEDHGHDHHH